MSTTNRSYELIDEKYEYKKIPLEEHQSNYIKIPWSIITDVNLDTRRVGIFSYLRVHYGLNSIVNFTIPDAVKWCGGKPDRSQNGTNDKFLSVLDSFNEYGYLLYLSERSKSSYMKCKFNKQYYGEQCKNGYAVIYLDEIDTIMNYQKKNSKDSTVNNFIILLVFAYLRHKIVRRPNLLKPEERFPEMIKDRQKRLPDAYNGCIVDMANEVGISSKTFSKIINILECDLHLIVTDVGYRIKNEDDEFRTPPTIFANTYKREDEYLLITGDNYSRNEIELKAQKIKEYFKDYEINKSKRKQ